MSLWGATVITSMVTVIPVASKYILQWLWGGYTLKIPTLVRFYTLHFVLPFLIAGFTLIHIALLHKVGSSSPVKSNNGLDDVPFYPYYVSKDLFAFSVYLLVFSFFVLYYPNFLNHPVNYIPANPMRTPAHVVPEWYFLPYYAILRSIPHKTGGILAMLGSLLVLFLIPFISTSEPKNTTDRPIFKIFFWIFISDILVLTWVGQKPVRDAYILTGQISTIYYFFFFMVMISAAGIIENCIIAFKVYKCDKAKISALEDDLKHLYSAPIYMFYYKYIKYNPVAFFVMWGFTGFFMVSYGFYCRELEYLIASELPNLIVLQENIRQLGNEVIQLKNLNYSQLKYIDYLNDHFKKPSFMEMERYKYRMSGRY